MVQELRQRTSRTRDVDSVLDLALECPAGNAGDILARHAESRREHAEWLERRGLRAEYVAFRLKESVLLLRESMPELALRAVHDAWCAARRALSPQARALVLTQLGDCLRERGDLRAALRAARRAEALLVAAEGDSLPQVLAVRAQIVSLMRARGMDTSFVEERMQRTLNGLAAEVRDEDGRRRLQRLEQVFTHSVRPPCWASLFFQRWRPVHSPGRDD